MSELEMAGRLALAAACSGLIGLEREATHQAAGLRTHVLVGVGAAIFTIVSVNAFEGADPARVAAQVVTGVGFLGAGAIFREGESIRGLTTAAGLWVAAGLGLAAGAGLVGLALAGAVLSFIVVFGFGVVEHAVDQRRLSREPPAGSVLERRGT